MPEAAFPKPVVEVVTTLAEIFRHQRRSEIVELLESASATIEQTDYDNWNDGTYTWALRLDVPVPVFASVEPRLEAVEKEIATKLTYLSRTYPNDHLDTVTIMPLSSAAAASSMRFVPSDDEVRRLWPEGRFRLFLSHVSHHKVAVSKLKEELSLRGVAAFVAHEDIVPSLDWQREIELALRSMHALVALITSDFHASVWADQEVGWAFGRGLLVVPVRLGTDPYGFAGKVQGITGNLVRPAGLATSIVDALLANPQTHGEMRRALVAAFTGSTSFAMSLALRQHVVNTEDFTEEEKDALRRACTDNDQISGAFRVADAIYGTFGKPPVPAPVPKQEIDDNIPF
jgi:hypothetical protein